MKKYQWSIDGDFFDRLEEALGIDRFTPYDGIITAAAKIKKERDKYKSYDELSSKWYDELLDLLELDSSSDDDEIRGRVKYLIDVEAEALVCDSTIDAYKKATAAAAKKSHQLCEIAAAFEALKAEAGKTGQLVLDLEKKIYG